MEKTPHRKKKKSKHVERLTAVMTLAETSPHHEYRLACSIFKASKSVGSAVNLSITHPGIPEGTTRHAEYNAISQVSPKIQGTIAYVARIRRDGSPALAKPCQNCQTLLFSRGVKRVFFTTNVPGRIGVLNARREERTLQLALRCSAPRGRLLADKEEERL